MEGHRIKHWSVALGVALMVGVLPGCGSSDDDESNAASSVGTTASATAPAAKKCDIGAKSIGYNDVLLSSIVQKRWQNAVEYATKALGWEYELLDAKADPAQALRNQRTLANKDVDAIITSSVAAEWVRPAAALLKQKDIPTINLITRASPGVFDGDVDEDAGPTASKMAEQVLKDFPDGAKVGILLDQAISAEQDRLKIIKEAFEGVDNITIEATHEQPISDQPGAAKATVDMLQANPDIEVMLTLSSELARYALQGLRQSGKSDIPVYSWYAMSSNAEQLKANANFRGVVDSDIAKASFVAIDELIKHFCGGKITPQQYVDGEGLFITKDDLDSRPSIAKEQGPVPLQELAEPFFKDWKEKYGVGPGSAPAS